MEDPDDDCPDSSKSLASTVGTVPDERRKRVGEPANGQRHCLPSSGNVVVR